MIIRNKNIQISIFTGFTFVLIVSFFLIYIFTSQDFAAVIWAIPILIMLFVIPLILNYMNQAEYQKLVPVYEKEAVSTHINTINPKMTGKIVRIEGKVRSVKSRIFNRPGYLVEDKTGSIIVKMFTNPSKKIKKDDEVVVLGQIIKKYIATGQPTINAVSIIKKN